MPAVLSTTASPSAKQRIPPQRRFRRISSGGTGLPRGADPRHLFSAPNQHAAQVHRHLIQCVPNQVHLYQVPRVPFAKPGRTCEAHQHCQICYDPVLPQSGTDAPQDCVPVPSGTGTEIAPEHMMYRYTPYQRCIRTLIPVYRYRSAPPSCQTQISHQLRSGFTPSGCLGGRSGAPVLPTHFKNQIDQQPVNIRNGIIPAQIYCYRNVSRMKSKYQLAVKCEKDLTKPSGRTVPFYRSAPLSSIITYFLQEDSAGIFV